MPFKSRAQAAYLSINKPELAKDFESKTPKAAYSKLPYKVAKLSKLKGGVK